MSAEPLSSSAPLAGHATSSAPSLEEVLRLAHQTLDPLAAGLSGHEAAAFWLRARLRLAYALGPLHSLYGATHVTTALALDLLRGALQVALDRSDDLRLLDRLREITPDWFQRPDMVGYVAYAERFGGTLAGVAERLDYLSELGVTYLHLMSVIEPRAGANDGGFAVADYRAVDPALGSMDELARLAESLRGRGISLCVDLVMNHTAAEHAWAAAARAGDERYRDYYLVYPDRTMPDRWEESLPQVFPDLAPGNFTWDEALQGWVWTTFNTYQWDLNYANPQVLVEMAQVMGFLANQGVEVLRLDAVAFTWKRLGTDCQNQPEAHLIVQVLSAFLAIAAPATICKAEAIVGPDQLVPYLGAHHVVRRECELAYHNQLMVMLWSSLATRDVVLMTHAHRRMASAPATTAWCTYVRCHDDIGWAVTDEDASSAGVGGASHRKFLTEFYRGDFPLSFARGVAFGANPENGDERTCGTAASLCGIDDARMRADDVALDLGIRRLLLLYGVILGFGGVPLLYMGDELALANDTGYLADPRHADDSRWIHRPVMDWSLADRRHRAETVEGRVFAGFRSLIAAKRELGALHASGRVEWLWSGDQRVSAFLRTHPAGGRLLVLANFGEDAVHIDGGVARGAGMSSLVDRLHPNETFGGGSISVEPLSVRWLVDPSDEGVQPRPA